MAPNTPKTRSWRDQGQGYLGILARDDREREVQPAKPMEMVGSRTAGAADKSCLDFMSLLFPLSEGRDINAKGAGRHQDLPEGGDLVIQRAPQCKEKQKRTLTRTL